MITTPVISAERLGDFYFPPLTCYASIFIVSFSDGTNKFYGICLGEEPLEEGAQSRITNLMPLPCGCSLMDSYKEARFIADKMLEHYYAEGGIKSQHRVSSAAQVEKTWAERWVTLSSKKFIEGHKKQ